MFKNLVKFVLFVAISLSLSGAIFAQNQQNETHRQYLARMAKEIQPYVVKIVIRAPVREGRQIPVTASGVAIFKEAGQEKDFSNRAVNYNSYYILTNPHVVSWAGKEGELKRYKEDRVKIYIAGKDRAMAEAEIVAWEWTCEIMLLKVKIYEDELSNYNIQVAKIAATLPTSLSDSRFSNKELEDVFVCGYPDGIPVVNLGYVSQYEFNFPFSYSEITKVADVCIDRFNGRGESGGGVFNVNKELAGIVFAGRNNPESNLLFVSSIDAIVERFLKQLPELNGLNLPSFKLEESIQIKNKPIYINRPDN